MTGDTSSTRPRGLGHLRLFFVRTFPRFEVERQMDGHERASKDAAGDQEQSTTAFLHEQPRQLHVGFHELAGAAVDLDGGFLSRETSQDGDVFVWGKL